MLLHIPKVLSAEALASVREAIESARWQDGGQTAGDQARQVKRNIQLPAQAEVTQRCGAVVVAALKAQPLFMSAVLPRRVMSPLFNCYTGGGTYGNHVDGAIQHDRTLGEDAVLRSDVSTTVFLSDPSEYDGGELVIEDRYGAHDVKLAAGDAVVYPATSLHRVEPVTRGTRYAAVLWSQSLVRDDWRRQMLFDLDMGILSLRQRHGDDAAMLALTSHYHNLLRHWAEV